MIITRNVDLSVGSVARPDRVPGRRPALRAPGHARCRVVFVLGIALGAACGLVNGVLVTWGQVPALVVTLGTLYVFRGLAFLWTDGRQVNAETLPDAFLNIGSDSILGVPYPRADRARRRAGRRPVAARLPRGPRAVRDRLQPRGRAAGRRALAAAAC